MSDLHKEVSELERTSATAPGSSTSGGSSAVSSWSTE